MSTVPYPKITIVGAGAIGGWLGARLSQTGAAVSVLARGETLTAVQRDGLRLHHSGAWLTAPVQTSGDAKSLGVQDLVVIAVKAPSLPVVAPHIGPLLGPHTVVLTAMNGVPWWFLQGFGGPLQGHSLHAVDPGGVVDRAIPAGHIVGAVVHASCSVDAPGVIRHHFGERLIIGEPSGPATARAQALQTLLSAAGFETTLSTQIQKDIWFKLWGNMTVNPISAITGATSDRLLDDDLVKTFMTQVMMEAKAIGQGMGIVMVEDPQDRHAVTRKLGAFRTSMLQDVQAGKPIELDALVGAVRELGQLTQVPTPFTDALLGLTRVMAQTRGLYP